jgi:hypothetical protein
MLAAMAPAVPPLDPPGVRVRSYGFSTCPPRLLSDMPPRANSWRFALARMSAPALRIFATVGASARGTEFFMLTLPAVVGMSAVSKLSLRMIGMQCRGPAPAGLALNRRSISAAVSSAFGLTVIIARKLGPFRL